MPPYVGENLNKAKKDFSIIIEGSQLSDPLVILKGLEELFIKVAESSKDPGACTYEEMAPRDVAASLLKDVDYASDTITPGSKTTLEELISAGVDLPNSAAGLASAMAMLACLHALFRHACGGTARASLDTSLVDSVLEQLAEDLENLKAPEDPGGGGAEYAAAKLEYDTTKKRLEFQNLKIKNLDVIYVFAVLIKAARSRGLPSITTTTILSTFKNGGTPAQLAVESKALIKKSSNYHIFIGTIDIRLFASDTLVGIKLRQLAQYGTIVTELQEIFTDTRSSQAVLTRKFNKAMEGWSFLVEDIITPVGSVNLVFPPCPHCGKDNHHESTCFAKNPALLKAFQQESRLRERQRALPARGPPGREAGAQEVHHSDGKMSNKDLDALGKEHFGTALAKPEVDLVTKYLGELMQKEQSTLLRLSPADKAKLIEQVKKSITDAVILNRV